MKTLEVLTKKYWIYWLVVVSIVLPWFFHSGYLFLTDFSWGPNMYAAWGDTNFLLFSLVGVLGLFIPVAFLQKLFLAFVVYMVLIGGKRLAEVFQEDKKAVFLVSLFSLFNPFVYDRLLYGQPGIILSYALILYAFGVFLSLKGKKDLLLGSLAVAFALQFSPHSIFFVALLGLIVILQKELNWRSFFKQAGIALAIVVILNINWISGIVFNSSELNSFVETGIGHSDLPAFATAGNTPIEVSKNVLMLSGFWGKDQFRYKDLTDIENLWGRSFIILVPLILLGIIMGLRSKRKLTISLIILFCISTFLAIGIKSPWSAKFTYWLFDNLPYYKGLRDTQKWVSLLALCYAVFLSLGIKYLLELKTVQKNIAAVTIFCAGVIIMQAPFLLWGFSGQVQPQNYPDSWRIANEHTIKPCDQNNLFLPWHLYMRFSFTGRVVANPAPYFFTCGIISGTNMEWGGIYDNSQDKKGKEVEAWISSKGKTTLNIRFILLAKEVDWKEYSWVDKLKGVKLTNETPEFKIYEVTN